MEASKLQYADLTESEKRFIARMEKARIENPASYLAIIAIILTPGTNEDVDWTEGYTRSEFKRAIKMLRAAQKEVPQYVGVYENAITFIRTAWLHRTPSAATCSSGL